ncbi:amino acid adenylation domain-containing protein [Micromonospora sp. NPDC049203]|uniref:amino acid adenylation domain-containing protein n=1 Tax=Micromonospora sp. NPDC049203 TaxID=3364267 RepID=UPI003716267E
MSTSGMIDVLPLSPLQEGLFFQHLYHRDGPDVYVTQLVLELSGDLDRAVLRRSWDAVLTRHPHLGAAFVHEGLDRPVQILSRGVVTPWRETDLTGAGEDLDAALTAELDADRSRRFAPAEPPMIRLLLARTGPARHRLAVTSHHILMDGWSVPILVRELLTLYAAGGDPAALPPPVPYRAYLAWLAGRDTETAASAWRATLSGVDEPTLVAPGGMPPATPRQTGTLLGAEHTDALVRLARSLGVTLSDVVQSAWAVVLGALTGRDDVVFGVVTAGRPAEIAGIDELPGLFINTVPVRVRLSPRSTLSEVPARLRGQRLDLEPHEFLSLAEIQAAAGVGELFDTVVVFENYPSGDLGAEAGGLRLTGVHGTDATHYPLMLAVVPGDRLRLRLDHVPGQPAGDVLAALVSVLTTMTTEPERRLGHADPFGGQGHRLLEERNGTAHPVPQTSLTGCLEQALRRFGTDVAVIDGDQRLTYGELDRRSAALAAELARHGAGPERAVGLHVSRSAALVVALLAIVRSGAAYLPLDPQYPAERLRYMIDEARPILVLTDGEPPAGTPALHLADVPAASRAPAPAPADDPASIASIIFTSGSTGAPKGVAGTRAGLLNRLTWFAELQPFAGNEALLAKSSISFIDGTVEILQTLVHGGRVVMADAATAVDMTALADLVARHEVRVLTAVPSLLLALLDEASAGPPGRLSSLRLVLSSGEPMPAELPDRLAAQSPEARLVNFCGCTEVSSESLFAFCDVHDRSIGTPLWNNRAYVLDGALRPVRGTGVAGDLYYGGAGVGRGYVRRPGATAERFVADPFGPPGARMFRTGDRVAYRQDGKLLHLGRSDGQLKVRGVRVEPSEVEAALTRHPAVAAAAVAVRRPSGGDPLLVGYVTPASGAVPDPADLRRYVATLLPPALVPSVLTVLDRLPRMPNGKVDRRGLPDPGPGTTAVSAPAGPREQVLCELFAEVLGLPTVGPADDFFGLGGHSLLATRLIARIRSALGTEVTLRSLFDTPTPAGLATRLGDAGRDPLDVLLPLRDVSGRPPLFCFHPAGGFSWCYTGLLRQLPADQPIFGLQARGLTDPARVADSADDMVAEYVSRIRAMGAPGPYSLLGWSLGGQLAHAAAARLQAEGEKPGLLVMLDSYPPETLPESPPLDRPEILRLVLREYFGVEPPAGAPLDTAAATALLRAAGVADLGEAHVEAVARILPAASAAARAYRPPVFDGDLLFFRATRGWSGPPPDPRAWHPYVSGGIEIHEVDTTHGRMTRPAELARISAVLRPRLPGTA